MRVRKEFHAFRVAPHAAPCTTNCRFEKGGNAEVIATGNSGTGFGPVRCARRCRGVCRCQRVVVSSIAALAQLVRAPAYEAGGRGFESRMPRHWIAQLGRASVLDTESRGFESCS